MLVTAGIDAGSGSTKAALLSEDGRILAFVVERTKADFDGVARGAFLRARVEAEVPESSVAYVATTGLGRYSVSFRDVQVTDITAAARGAWFHFPDAAFVLDMGAQSTRAIRLKEGGRVREFHCNEKCAAGSGSFLQRAARYLEVPLDSLGGRSLEAAASRPISSVCAVLAESEIINHVSEGVPVNDIVRGLHDSLASRALTQLRKVGWNGEPVIFVGGVAVQEGMVEACRRAFGSEVRVPPHPSSTTAVGAAVLGMQRAKRKAVSSATG